MHNNNKDKESIEEEWELVEKEDRNSSVDIPSVDFGDGVVIFLPGTSYDDAYNIIAIAETGWPLPRSGQEYVQYGLAQAGGGIAEEWIEGEADDDLASVSSAGSLEGDEGIVGNVIPESSDNEAP